MDEWIKKMWDRSIYTHTQTYIYIYIEGDIKIGSCSFATTYMHLEGIISLGNGLAKKVVQVFLYHLMEKPKRAFWSLQKEKYVRKRQNSMISLICGIKKKLNSRKAKTDWWSQEASSGEWQKWVRQPKDTSKKW